MPGFEKKALLCANLLRLLLFVLALSGFFAVSCASTKNYKEKPLVLWIEASSNFSRLQTKDSIRFYLDKAKETGFNEVVVDVKRVFGDVMYKSGFLKTCREHKGVIIENRGFDYLEYFIKEAHKRKMKVSAALAIFPAGYPIQKSGAGYEDSSLDGFFCQEYLPEGIKDIRESKDPSVFAFLSPVYPEVHDYVIRMVKELVGAYGFDALVLDYCRWQNVHSDFSTAAKKAFEDYAGVIVENFPDDIYKYKGNDPWGYIPGVHYNKWLEWRASVIKRYVSDIRAAAKALKPKMGIEYWAASWLWSLYGTGQNWAASTSSWADNFWWGGKGYSAQGFGEHLDRFMVGAYLEDIYGAHIQGTAENAIAFARKAVSPSTELLSSFHVTGKDYPVEDAAYLNYRDADGLMVFDMSSLVSHNAWGRIAEGVSRAKKEMLQGQRGFPTKNETAAAELAERIIPDFSNRFVFKEINGEKDVFELESKGRKIIIRGNNANSMAVGLNYYLKNYCLATVSWYASDKVEMPKKLPVLNEKIRIEARADKRFFLNYCTFGYTMPWWKWEDWERFIDWMALNGVNMPLAITGQEAVWQKVWKEFGLTDGQIREYFTGPAHLPWHRMNNIDYWQGPLPQGWIDAQAKLQKKILARERMFNMCPVLPAFAGHVPEDFAKLHPEAAISSIPEWGGFDKKYLCRFLSSEDPLYSKIQKRFLTIQTGMYGTDHIYGMDLFNEVDAPSWNPQTLASIASRAYASIQDVDSEAVWLQMGWLFYADQKHWDQANMEAYLKAVPKGRLIMLDYYIEDTEIWKMNRSFYGQDYILCYLGNFGGNTMLFGNFKETSSKIEEGFASGGENLIGLGSTLEGFGVNRFMYEFVLDKAWKNGMTDEEWIERLADRQAGRADSTARKAWKTIADSIYIAPDMPGQATLTNAHPCFEGNWRWTTRNRVPYSLKTLERVVAQLKLVDSKRYSWKYDLVNFERQLIGDSFTGLRDGFTSAYRSGDLEKARLAGDKMLEAIDELDGLLADIPEFSLDKWIKDAEDFGTNPQEKAYYAENARTIVSVWGDSYTLTDYANRNWNGLLSSYYKVRWKMFIDKALECMKEGRDFDTEAFDKEVREFEISWAKGKP